MRLKKNILACALFFGFGCSEDTLNRLATPSEPSPSAPQDAGVYWVDAGHLNEDAFTDAMIFDQGVSVPEDAGHLDAQAPADSGVAVDSGTETRECYTEPFDPTINISDLQEDYNRRRRSALATIMQALQRRYPAGHALLLAEQNDPYTGSFIDRSSFGTVMESAMTEVHEATHGWDYGHSLFRVHFDYWLTDTLQHSLSFDVDGLRAQTSGPYLKIIPRLYTREPI